MSVNKYNSTSGELERIDSIVSVDSAPTSGSTNPISSGGVYNSLADKVNYADNGVLGAKNLLPQVEYANATTTINGVTITSREDGSVLLNGTSTAAVSYHFIRLSSDADRKFIKQVAGKKVTISGTNASNTNVRVQFWSTTTNVIADTTGKGTTFTIPSDLTTTGDYNFAIWIPSGTTINNVIVYPMLRLASDPDDTYVPYAMTNKQLTDLIGDGGISEEEVTVALESWVVESYTATTGTVYPYKYSVAITGLTASSWVDVDISSGSYTWSFAIESTSGYAVIRMSSRPSSSMSFRIYYKP